MDDNNNDPIIEPAGRKPVLKNQTPAILSEAASNVVLFLEKYGWFVVLGVITAVFIWTKIEPYWRKWKKKWDEQIEEQSIDPAKLAKSQEALQMSHRRMQEAVEAKGAEYADKLKELQSKQRQEKIDDWERHQQGRGYRPKNPKAVDDHKQQENKVKPKKSGRLRNSDYNPLTGSSSGSSYRPNRRNTGGG